MKKLLIALVMLFGYVTSASAISGVNFGISITAGQFEADGASENFKGAHVSSTSPGDVTKKASAEGDSAEALFGYGSIFIEKTLGDRLAIGVDYVPMDLDTETAENSQHKMWLQLVLLEVLIKHSTSWFQWSNNYLSYF